ncbi:MAG: hypothetical protein MI725_11345 [Pirellulales bacterium]|nr:hypothetical protein [Pirellulales bacterium]
MNGLAHNENIQRLEQRQEELIAELDALNGRLEQVLNSLVKPTEQLPCEQEILP